jgi:O-antigen ligase
MVLRDFFKAETWRLSRQIWLALIATSVAYLVFLTTTVRSLVACGALLALFNLITPPAARSHPAWLTWPAWVWSGLALTAYIAVSTIWSADPRTTAMTAAILGALIIGSHWAACQIGRLSRTVSQPPTGEVYLEHITRTVMVIFTVAMTFLLIEILNGDAIKQWLFWPFRAFDWKTFAFDRSTVVTLSLDDIKWRMPAVNFIVWPVMFMIGLHFKSVQRSYAWQAALLTVVVWLNWVSAHGASRAAMLAALIAFPLAIYRPALTRHALAAMWVLAFITVVPAAQAFYRAEMHTDKRIKWTMNARFIIWAYTADHIKDRPLTGHGAAATTLINKKLIAAGLAGEPSPGHPYTWSPGPHAHNIFLQSWYELGMIGSALLCAFGLFVLRLTAAVPLQLQPYMLTSFVTLCVTSSASFGLFEPWFMGAYALCAMTSVIALAYDRAIKSQPMTTFTRAMSTGRCTLPPV